jgi:hypothetical protein
MSNLKTLITTLGGVVESKVQSPFKTSKFIATADDLAFDSSLEMGKVYTLFVAQADGTFSKSNKPYTKGTWFVIESK